MAYDIYLQRFMSLEERTALVESQAILCIEFFFDVCK